MDVDPEGRERARVFAADDARANDREARRQRLNLEELRRVVDAVVLEGEHRGAKRRRTGGDEHVCGAQQFVGRAKRGDADRMRIDKAAHAGNAFDACLLETHDRAFPRTLADALPRRRELVHARLGAQRDVDAEQTARLQAAQCKRRLPQRFARYRAGIEAGAADVMLALDERDATAKQGTPSCTRDAGGPSAKNNEIELAHG